MEEHPLHTPAGEPIGAADQSPEARRKRALRWRAGLDEAVEDHLGPGSRAFCIANRVWTGAYQRRLHPRRKSRLHGDPGAVSLLHHRSLRSSPSSARPASATHRSHAFLTAMPPVVARVIEPVARERDGRAQRLAAVDRRARRPVDRRQPDRDDPRHPPPRLRHSARR